MHTYIHTYIHAHTMRRKMILRSDGWPRCSRASICGTTPMMTMSMAPIYKPMDLFIEATSIYYVPAQPKGAQDAGCAGGTGALAD
jgi:hypothetical protein